MVINVNMTIQNVILVMSLAVGGFFPIRKAQSFSRKTGDRRKEQNIKANEEISKHNISTSHRFTLVTAVRL